MFKSLLFIVFIIVFAIYFISIKIRQYPKNQDDPNIKLRRIESACGIINIATFAILLSSSSLYAFKVPEIIVKGIAIFAVCTVIFSLCLILLIQKLIQKLPIDETDNTFRHRLHLWGQNMLKLFSEKIRSIIPAGKKRVVPQQQSTEEHSVVTDSNTKIKNNDETSNIFIAIIFIVTLFLFATTFYYKEYLDSFPSKTHHKKYYDFLIQSEYDHIGFKIDIRQECIALRRPDDGEPVDCLSRSWNLDTGELEWPLVDTPFSQYPGDSFRGEILPTKIGFESNDKQLLK